MAVASRIAGVLSLSFGLLVLASCTKPAENASQEPAAAATTAAVEVQAARLIDGDAIINADSNPGEWLSHGRTYSEQRYSPLTKINSENVEQLGLAWSYDLPTRRGIEATPLIANGKMYTTGSWSIVYALDAKNGDLLWQYDPKLPKDYSAYTCCDVVNRRVALWGNKVYVGTIDGRLIAINSDTGESVWDVDTRVNQAPPYSITGAPRIVNGKVIIGNGGAEMHGARGYVSAYDSETGKLLWRFFTVPGNPADGFEDDTQKWIAETWNGEWWKSGGGGTAWDSFAFDPDLNLLYVGVGNGSSWNQKIRSPGGGDNLFLSSIVAVDADTGEYKWHYQTTPGDNWDYTATQHMILAELEIDGKQRQVIMQAPKNGFFYVIDRATGELLSADKYSLATWASHVDMKTGRPVEVADARKGTADITIFPGPSGAHNWHPMSFSPRTGMVYIPAMETSAIYQDDFTPEQRKTIWNTNYNAAAMVALPDQFSNEERVAIGPMALKGVLIAWDPVNNKEVWRKEQGYYSSSGLLSTASDLVFQGDLTGEFYALSAVNGDPLWSTDTQAGIMASPISYEIDGEQYVAVMQGWGGETGLPFGAVSGPQNMINVSRVLVYKLGGSAELSVVETTEQTLSAPTPEKGSEESVAAGRSLYDNYCAVCHGGNAVSAGLVPDLRYRISDIYPAWQAIVMQGGLSVNGMPAWKDFMTAEEADSIRDYVVHEATLGHARGEKRLVRSN